MTVGFYTLGCKVNQYETDAISEIFKNRQYDIAPFESYADIYVINTCTVTNFGDKKSRQIIRKAKRYNENGVIVVTGCYAQTASEEVMKMDEVDIVCGTNNRSKIVDLVEDFMESHHKMNTVSDITDEFEEISISDAHERTRAYVKVQDGCRQFCSYCIIPYARGPVRSRSLLSIQNEVQALSEHDVKEVILTGIHIASYGKDLDRGSLYDVVNTVSAFDAIKRIRFSSLEPTLITEEFSAFLKNNGKICDHFHLSLQSGCDKTLKRMNRKYNTDDFKKAVSCLRRHFPDVSLTTDVIVGFPGETEEDFAHTYEFCNQIGFAKIHVFPYSPKKGTHAAGYPDQIINNVKEKRAEALIKLSDEMGNRYINQYIGKTLDILFEQQRDGIYSGHSSNYITVSAPYHIDICNEIKQVKVTKNQQGALLGEIADYHCSRLPLK